MQVSRTGKGAEANLTDERTPPEVGAHSLDDVLGRLRAGSDRPLGEFVNRLVEAAVEVTRSTIGYFAVMDEEETQLTMLAWSKTAMAACAMMEKPIEYPLAATGIWGDCIRERQAVITNDYQNCTRVTKKGYPDGHVHVVRHLNVPVQSGAQLKGILGVGNKAQDYTAEDAATLQALANAAWPLFAQVRARSAP